jgi:phenylpropionate dioxygenase-like ring-hydroxylating dioxygenase large terminal subunit
MLEQQFQPLCLAAKVGRQPIAATVAGEAFAAFRAEDGKIAVFVDRCPHRGMRLSEGRIENGYLACPYHGWRFAADGRGESPANPKLRPRAEAVDAVEAGGVVWVRRGSGWAGSLPPLAIDGYQLVHCAFQDIDAPVEVVLDNFTEIEHTGPGHWEFGYDPRRMREVSFVVQADEDRVHGRAVGPQKRLSRLSSLAMGVATGDRLTVEIDTRYAPLRIHYDWWWQDRATDVLKGPRFKEIAFFAPLGAERSRLVAFYYWTMRDSGRLGLNRLVRAAARQVIRYEIKLDVALCSNLTRGSETLDGCHLGRFDAMLPHHRRRLAAGKTG